MDKLKIKIGRVTIEAAGIPPMIPLVVIALFATWLVTQQSDADRIDPSSGFGEIIDFR